MKKIERRYDVELRAMRDDENGAYIVGVPIVFDAETDLFYYVETIDRHALDKTDMKDVRFLVNHNTDMIPLARSRNNNAHSTMQMWVEEDGMHIRVNLDIERNSEAKALYSAVDRGDVSGMSFMFSVDEDKWEGLDTETPKRTITSIGKVYEVSAVTFPAYEQTSIQAADITEALDNARETLESVKRANEDEAKRAEIRNLLRGEKE